MNAISWAKMYENCRYNNEAGELSELQTEYKEKFLSLADVQRAISARIKAREPKRKYEKPKTHHKNVLSHTLYIEIAQYYEEYYVNGKLRKKEERPEIHTPDDFVEHKRTKKTKHINYCHARYDEIIKNVKNTEKRCATMSDNEFIAFLYLKSGQYAFSQRELDAWCDIYTFATTQTFDFTTTERANRRKRHSINGSFVDFAEWYRDDFEIYSSRDRFFIPLFIKHNSSYSATELDELLRYDSAPECFSKNDIAYLHSKLGDDFDSGYFFDVLNTICKMSQKKQL